MNSKPSFVKASEKIRMEIEAAIRDGSLLPGDSIDEAELSTQHQVSRTPIREALIQLQAQGLLSSLARGGMVVAKMSLQQLLALMELLADLSQRHLARLPVKSGDRISYVRVADIECIESAGNYVVVHAGGKEHVLRETLSELESQLDPAHFLRVSRGAIVNLDHVRELQPLFKGDHVVVLRSGRTVPMTRGIREVERALRFG